MVDGGLVGWWDGGMAGWWDGGMVGWWDGGMVGWSETTRAAREPPLVLLTIRPSDPQTIYGDTGPYCAANFQ